MLICGCKKCCRRERRVIYYLDLFDRIMYGVDREFTQISLVLPGSLSHMSNLFDASWARLILVKNEFNFHIKVDRDDRDVGGLFSNMMSDHLLLNCPWELLDDFDICCNFTSFLGVVVEILYTIKQNLVYIINEVKRIQKDPRLSKKSRKRKAGSMDS